MKIASSTAYLGRSSFIFTCLALSAAILARFTYATHPAIGAFAMVFVFIFCGLIALQLINQLTKYFPPSIARIIRWIYAMSIETFAILALALLHPLRYVKSGKKHSQNTFGRPILLIHGYLHDCSGWIYQRRRLKAAGFGPIYTLNLGHPFRSICDYAKKIDLYAERIEKETKRADLILIGHSMGGLVASWYALRIKPGKVTDVITIGSPLAGTVVAQIALGPNGREMKQGSELIGVLQQEIKNAKQTRFYQIATRTDQLIIPHSSALIGEDPKKQLLMEDVGHVGLLFSPRVADQICHWLAQVF